MEERFQKEKTLIWSLIFDKGHNHQISMVKGFPRTRDPLFCEEYFTFFSAPIAAVHQVQTYWAWAVRHQDLPQCILRHQASRPLLSHQQQTGKECLCLWIHTQSHRLCINIDYLRLLRSVCLVGNYKKSITIVVISTVGHRVWSVTPGPSCLNDG